MSDKNDEQIRISEEDASGGTKRHNVRYVLGFSLFAAIIALSAIWMFGAFG